MRILHDNVLDACSVYGDALQNFDVSGVQHSDLCVTWRSVTLAAATLLFKAPTGTKITLDSLAIINHNLGPNCTARLQMNDVNSWSAPSVDVVITGASDVWKVGTWYDSVWLDNTWLAFSASSYDDYMLLYFFNVVQSYTYLRLVFTDTSNPDAYIEVGRAGGYARYQMEGVPEKEIVDDVEDSTTTSISASGQLRANVGVQAQRYDVPLGTVLEVTRQTLKEIYALVGQHTPIVLVPDEDLLDVFRPIYCHFIDKPKFTQIVQPYWRAEPLKVQEVF